MAELATTLSDQKIGPSISKLKSGLSMKKTLSMRKSIDPYELEM
jgi:hypothetical protein